MSRLRRIAAPLGRLVLALGLALPAAAGAEPLRIYAAASLTEAVEALADGWAGGAEAAYAGSSTLARQIELGAPADVFISANAAWVDHLAAGGLLAGPGRAVASNRLVAVWRPDEAAEGLSGWLAAPEGLFALADVDAVPAGVYAREALERMGAWKSVEPRAVYAQHVRDALAWVSRGDAAIAIVYATDAATRPELASEPLDPALHAPIAYVAAPLTEKGEDFVAWLLGEQAQTILTDLGFAPPPG